MHYNALLQKLLSETYSKLGLENMQRMAAALGHPEKKYRTVQVAGTNGKGSVCTKIAASAHASGLKVGLYTSPHISCFRERIRVNGEMISEATIERLLPPLLAFPGSFFERTTALAFAYFAEQEVDLAVIEVGIGGRWDATNIIHSELAIITSISLDHTEILGSTEAEIAEEKWGIVKPRSQVLLGPRVPLDRAEKVVGTFATYHDENRAIAKRACEILDIAPLGIEALPPCRMEWVTPRIVLDVAHNPDGLTHLFRSLPQGPYQVICGLSSNKDIAACAAILHAHASTFYLVEAATPRAASLESLQKAFPEGIPCSSIRGALHLASQRTEPLLICGTFFIMAEARAALGIQEPRDPLPYTECLPLPPGTSFAFS